MKKKLILVVGLGLLLTACGNKEIVNNTNNKNVENKTENSVNIEKNSSKKDETNIQNKEITNNGNVSYEDISITPEEAARIFKNKNLNVNIKEVSLELKSGSYVYELSGYNETGKHKIKLNPATGSIISEKSETGKNLVQDFAISDDHLSKINSLVDQSLKDAGDGYFLDEWEIELDDGIIELKVELKDNSSNEIEYEYNVETGVLIEKDN